MQLYTVYLFLWNALHVSGSSSPHHQELKTVYKVSGTLSKLYCRFIVPDCSICFVQFSLMFLYRCFFCLFGINEFDVHGSVHRKRIFKYNQQDAMLHNLFISVKCSTCFRWFLRPSSGAQICIYSIGYFVKLCCYRRLSWKRFLPVLSSWWWAEEPP